MPGPFPGMDPWLESPAVFPDLHNSLITYIGEALNAVLPEPYFARSATRVWVEEDRIREPDVSLLDPSDQSRRTSAVDLAASMAAVGMIAVEAAPFVPEPHEEPFIEVRSTAGDRLVTAVEILSLSNKSTGDKGREAYRQKQVEYLTEDVNLVEIDLLRGGEHTTAVHRARLRALVGFCPYHICVSGRAFERRYFVGAIQLADRLPSLAVPLDRNMTPVRIELQPLLDRCYDGRRYARQVHYDRPPDPPLTPDQQAWAEAILREKGVLP